MLSRRCLQTAAYCISALPAGEIHEYKEDLASLDKGKKKDAVKKVIAAMTVGKDVSMLFPHVVNCMQTDDLELKKLVYLYLINYAKTQPDLAIMGVNTFVKVRVPQMVVFCLIPGLILNSPKSSNVVMYLVAATRPLGRLPEAQDTCQSKYVHLSVHGS